ncbi:hypothetical protein [Hyphomicrobium sp. MC1]|uniref:hypothetical protein n=1 Tax=Hyphomicrobium sp. (strain MC1) TaxID=717785 RepID=UPI000213DAB5|nr:hypothetical protein [Hyphomicrobium sp. MC1]CCB64474.1 conserved protein of unknown function [Hyphomicrobium sp. MC1]
MAIIPFQLPTGSTKGKFLQGGACRLINCYASEIGPEGKVPRAIYSSDGLQGFCLLQGVPSTIGCRAALNLDDVALYVVAGTALYKVSQNGNQTLIGSMNISTTAPVFMVRNRRVPADVTIVCDGLMYNCRNDVLSQVTDPDLSGPTSLDYSDGYMLITTALSKFQISAIDDATSWDGLDFATADGSPDALVRVITYQAYAYLMGAETTEVWQDTGGSDFAYSRAYVIPVGIFGAASAQKVSDSIFWIGHDKTVRRLSGGDGAVVISEPDVENDIQATEDASTIRSAAWIANGRMFYMISTPDWTWVYDTSMKRWHERQTYGQKNWQVSFVVGFGTKIIAGDVASGALYEMSAKFTDDAGKPLISSVVLPRVHAFPYRLRYYSLYLDVQKGVGVGQGASQDVDPEIMVEWSDDGGATYKGQRTLKIGQQGKPMVRVRTHRLGQAGENGRDFRISWSAKVDRALYQAAANVRQVAA